jgi:hypothetical protein
MAKTVEALVYKLDPPTCTEIHPIFGIKVVNPPPALLIGSVTSGSIFSDICPKHSSVTTRISGLGNAWK